MPYLIKNSAGVWCVQRKVPEQLQTAVARVLGSKKQTQVYLKKSLGTKDRREANRRAVHALADLDRTLREAEALTRQQPPKSSPPLRTTLNDAEIKRMAEYVYAKALAWDERTRYGRDELKRIEAEHERLEGPLSGPWAFPYETLPEHGLSPAQLADQRQQLGEELTDMRECLALGNISAIEDRRFVDETEKGRLRIVSRRVRGQHQCHRVGHCRWRAGSRQPQPDLLLLIDDA